MSKILKRIVTNSDLDAITSCVLLRAVEPIGDVKFIDLDEIRKGWKGEETDIAVNIPYVEGCGLWFEHHDSNVITRPFAGRHESAPSAARVVYRFYAPAYGPILDRYDELLRETDKVDSAAFARDDILDPRRYVLISHLISSQPVMDGTVEDNLLLIRLLSEGPAEHALAHPTFARKAEAFLANLEMSKAAILQRMMREGNILIMDQRDLTEQERDLCNNKFLPYVLFDGADVLVRVKPLEANRTIVTVGFNIFSPDQRLRTHIGNFLKQFGGGGHPKAGGCSMPPPAVDETVRKIVDALLIRTP